MIRFLRAGPGPRRLQRLRRSLARRLGTAAPVTRLHLRAPVPGVAVRLLPAAAMAAATALVPQVGTAAWAWTAVAAAAAVRWPGSPAVPAYGGLLGVLVLAGPDLLRTGDGGAAAGPWRLAGMVAALHLAHRTDALATHVGPRTRVEAAVLLRAVRSLLPVQLVAQATLLVTVLLRAGLGTRPGADGPRVVAVLAALGAALLVLPGQWRYRRRRDAEGDPPGGPPDDRQDGPRRVGAFGALAPRRSPTDR